MLQNSSETFFDKDELDEKLFVLYVNVKEFNC